MSEHDVFDFALGLDPAMTWRRYLQRLDDRQQGRDLPAGVVPETFLLAVIDDEIVGRVGIRHTLDPPLSRRGGHIGYAVLQPTADAVAVELFFTTPFRWPGRE
ncbi:GNAT family N-acetyltransferase [Nocardia fusca]|uniref:GNAT family N-acetyltransferase n=1 Tax=Nocardia fusca TaxID=941183 RepID=A0ABV3F0R8_9NOCA